MNDFKQQQKVDNDQRASSSTSFLAAYAAYRRRDNHAEAFSAMLSRVSSDLDFIRQATRCLSIGTGTGSHELEFIDQIMPSIESFIGIEPDHDSAIELRVHLARSLPHVEYTIRELPVERWEGPSEPVDVVLIFHFMYYCINADLRRQFCRHVYDWTVDGGVTAILMDRHDESPKGIHQVCRAKNVHRQIPSYDRIRSELIDVGFQAELEYEFRYSRDWSNPDPDLLRFIQMIRGVQLSAAGVTDVDGGSESLGEIRVAMHQLRIDQTTEGRTVFGVFRKVAVPVITA